MTEKIKEIIDNAVQDGAELFNSDIEKITNSVYQALQKEFVIIPRKKIEDKLKESEYDLQDNNGSRLSYIAKGEVITFKWLLNYGGEDDNTTDNT